MKYFSFLKTNVSNNRKVLVNEAQRVLVVGTGFGSSGRATAIYGAKKPNLGLWIVYFGLLLSSVLPRVAGVRFRLPGDSKHIGFPSAFSASCGRPSGRIGGIQAVNVSVTFYMISSLMTWSRPVSCVCLTCASRSSSHLMSWE